MDIAKLTATAVEVSEEIITPTITKTTTIERKALEQRIADITAHRDHQIEVKQRELDECAAIIAEMDRLGVVAQEPAAEIIPETPEEEAARLVAEAKLREEQRLAKIEAYEQQLIDIQAELDRLKNVEAGPVEQLGEAL